MTLLTDAEPASSVLDRSTPHAPARYFGLEVEFRVLNVTDLSQIGQNLHACKYTQSPDIQGKDFGKGNLRTWRFEEELGIFGGEVISPKSIVDRDTLNEIEHVLGILRRNSAFADKSTGIHVHVDTSDLNTLTDWQNLYALYHRYESELRAIAGRRSPGGINRITDALTYPDPGYKAESFWALMRHYGTRTHALSAFNVSSKHSGHVEFRLWDSTLNFSTVEEYIQTSLGLVNAAKNLSQNSVNYEEIECFEGCLADMLTAYGY